MKHAVLVFLGGGMGSVLRYYIGLWLNESIPQFPMGTFTVNVLGAFLMGLLLGQAAQHPEFYRTHVYFLWGIGFCGGFTTFSAFVIDQVELLGRRQIPYFFTYVVLSIAVGLLAGYWSYKGLKSPI